MLNIEIFLIISTMLFGMDIPDPHNNDRDSTFKKYINTNHKRSYITVLEGIGNIKPLYFEASITPYYLIRLKDEYRWAIELNPAMTFRMQRAESFPIRTPSYMPRITYYHNLRNTRFQNKRIFPFLSVVHHSNGQNGDFYNDDGSINTSNGNFSTNYLELGAFMTKLNPSNANQRFFFKPYLEYHFANEENLKGKYGFFRVNFDFQMIHQLSPYADKKGKKRKKSKNHRIRQSFHTEWIFGNMGDVRAENIKERLKLKYTFSYHPGIAEDMSIFLQFYHGQDYYNIYFHKTINILRFGLMTDQLKFW